MGTTEIIRVERFAPDSDALLGFSIELPTAGISQDGYSFEFAGWALGARSPAVQVELVANDGPVRTVPIIYPRPDVDRAFPAAPQNSKVGFWTRVSVIGMTPDFELLIQVRLENDARVSIGRIGGRHQPIPPCLEPAIQPLMVNSLGRMGTTWMMRLLSEHPSIVALRIHPYETRPGKYWIQRLRDAFWKTEPLWNEPLSTLGSEQSWGMQDRHWFNSRFVQQVAMLCQRSVEASYREIADFRGQELPLYFAEKHIPDEIPGIVWELYPQAREIVVVRDFRDMLCSIRAFNAKRGTNGFNRDKVDSEEQYIHRLGREAQQLLRNWKSRSNRTCLVRYEDLITQPTETLQRVLTYLQVEDSRATVEEMLRKALADTPEMEAHRTSGTARQSIARWHSELDEDSKILCNHIFADALKEFGYPVDQEVRVR